VLQVMDDVLHTLNVLERIRYVQIVVDGIFCMLEPLNGMRHILFLLMVCDVCWSWDQNARHFISKA
jgi:hypothetical protein